MTALAPIASLMEARDLDFDEARLQLVKEAMAQMDCNEEGMPLDDKLFTFCQVSPPTVQTKVRGSKRRLHCGFERRPSRTLACFLCF